EKWQCMETRARFHKLLKQYQEQLKIKQQMKDLFPQLPESWELLSLAYLDSGKPDEGIKHIEKALEMRRYQRALSHYNLAFYKKAEQLLQGPQKSHLRLVLKDVMELGFHHHKDVSRGMVITHKFLKNYSLTKDLLEKA